MGVEVGFKFYRCINGKLEKANIIKEYNDTCNYIFICGRCEATYTFIRLVEQFEKEGSYKDEAKPEDKYSSYLLLNRPELDGYEDHDGEKYSCGWYKKYFYLSLEDFKSHFDFDEAQRKHNETLKELREELIEHQQEIESLRVHQENAKTKMAFECFEEKIKETKQIAIDKKEYIKDIEEDDYDYNHYMWIKEDIMQVEKIMEENPDIVVVAFASY